MTTTTTPRSGRQQRSLGLGRDEPAVLALVTASPAVVGIARDVAALLAISKMLRADNLTQPLLALLPSVDAGERSEDDAGQPILRGISRVWSSQGVSGISSPRSLAVALHSSRLLNGASLDRVGAAAAGLLNNAPLVLSWAAQAFDHASAEDQRNVSEVLITAVVYLVEAQHADAALFCLFRAAGPLADYLEHNGCTATVTQLLSTAARRGNVSVLRAVLTALSSTGHHAPLSHAIAAAVENNQTNVVQLCAERDEQVLRRVDPRTGLLPLHVAAQARSLASMRCLLELGCDVNALSGAGYSPLHLAVDEAFDEGVELLLRNGASLHAGQSAAACSGGLQALALELGHVACAETLGRFER